MNKYKERVLDVLCMSVRALTTKEVAHYATVDWSTANKYLLELKLENKISDRLLGGRVHQWRLTR